LATSDHRPREPQLDPTESTGGLRHARLAVRPGPVGAAPRLPDTIAVVTDGFDEVAARLEARGCDPDELAQVEADQGVRLPGSYRRMLRTMGRDMGGLFGGSDVAFPQV